MLSGGDSTWVWWPLYPEPLNLCAREQWRCSVTVCRRNEWRMNEAVVLEASLFPRFDYWLTCPLPPHYHATIVRFFDGYLWNGSFCLSGLWIIILSLLWLSSNFFKRYFCFELPGFGCSGKYLFEVSGDIAQCRCWNSSKGMCSALLRGRSLWGFNLMLPFLFASRNVALRRDGNKHLSPCLRCFPPKHEVCIRTFHFWPRKR